jgi:hypothetical protein
VPEGKIDISPRHYQKLIKKLAGKPEELHLVTRSVSLELHSWFLVQVVSLK